MVLTTVACGAISEGEEDYVEQLRETAAAFRYKEILCFILT